MNFNEPKLNISLTQIQEAVEELDPKKNLKNIAASAAEILAESQLSTKSVSYTHLRAHETP